MIRLIATISILFCLNSLVYAQSSKRLAIVMPCDKVHLTLDVMKKQKEGLLIDGTGFVMSTDGRSYPARFGLFVNQDTGTFSAVALFNDNTACLLFPGANFLPYSGKQPWDLIPPDVNK